MKRIATVIVTFMLMFSFYSIDKEIDLIESIEYRNIIINHTDLPFEH